MFTVRGENVYFALFDNKAINLTPSFADALSKYSFCAECGRPLMTGNKPCGCNEGLPENIYEDSGDLCYRAFENKEDYNKAAENDFSELIGIYYFPLKIFYEIINPLYKKHLRKMVYGPNNRKVRNARLNNSLKNKYTDKHLIWLEIAQNSECYYCSHSIKDDYQVEHLIPLAHDGDNSFSNIVLACPPCNKRKHSKSEFKFWQIIKKELPIEIYNSQRNKAKKLIKLKKLYK